MVDFQELQKVYKLQMDSLLAQTGLTTRCIFNYGISKKNICPNCIYDVNLKQSSGKYKAGGPRPFVSGRICPYCNGAGFYGETQGEEAYLAIIWNSKDWIIKPVNLENANMMIQTICDKTLYAKIKKCKDITVIYSDNNANPLFELADEPQPAGLGDNNYLITNWKKIGIGNTPTSMVT